MSAPGAGPRSAASKLGTLAEVVPRVGEVRRQARTVALANGDGSVRRLKGTGRPILPEDDRARLVAALRAVDHVLVFEEDDVSRLLLELRPDVHCKGTDYTAETVPERDVVRSYGGRIAIVGDPKDHDTRALIARMRT